jgi:isopentenyl phosphate kinase
MAPDGHTRRTTAEGFVVHGGDSKEHDRAAEVLLKTAREVNLREAGIKEIAEALAHYAQG